MRSFRGAFVAHERKTTCNHRFDTLLSSNYHLRAAVRYK